VSELERELLALREAVAWPPTPDLATALHARLAADPSAGGVKRTRPQRSALLHTRRARLALAAVIAVIAGALAVSPAGASLLRWIGIAPTIRVTEVARLPLARDPAQTGLGRPVSLTRARLLADFPLRVPARPERVRFSAAILGGAVTLDYRDARVTQWAGSSTGYFEKLVAPPAKARRVQVNGDAGVFISGGPTTLLAADRKGDVTQIGGARQGTNVLLWEDGEIAFRLETRGDLAQALAFARRLL
jgi:hypothetical protein